MQIHEIPREISIAYAGLAIVVASFRGGDRVRVVGAIVLEQLLTGEPKAFPWLAGLPNDLIALGACLLCLMRGRGAWLVWATAAALLSVATDILYGTGHAGRWAFLSASLVWFYVLVGAVFAGAITDSDRVRPDRARPAG
jgi:hypothetical protein